LASWCSADRLGVARASTARSGVPRERSWRASRERPTPTGPRRRSDLELEVSPDAPRSVTTWFVVVDGILYVPSASAAKKTWPGLVEKDGRVRVRIDGKLYELHAMRVSDPAIGKKLSEAVTAKYGFGDGQPVPDAWAFALLPRA
jgi:hypothetical protein